MRFGALGSTWNGDGRSHINIVFQDGYIFMITQEGLMEQSDDWLLEEVVINIQEGMSFEEVQDVIGGNPASITVSGTSEAITWRDHGSSSIRATFVDGELLDFVVVFVTHN